MVKQNATKIPKKKKKILKNTLSKSDSTLELEEPEIPLDDSSHPSSSWELLNLTEFLKPTLDNVHSYLDENVYKPTLDSWKQFKLRPYDTSLRTLNLFLAILFSFVLWRTLMIYTNSNSPVVVVLSGSMEPAFQRGDILFLDNTKPINIGDVVVFEIDGRDIPIVHRVISIHLSDDEDKNKSLYLTKGDANDINDRGLYAQKEMWLYKDKIIGQAHGKLPYVGYFTIWINDRQALKHLLLGGTFLLMMSGYS